MRTSNAASWRAYSVLQRARRHVRVAERLGQLRDLVPTGVELSRSGPTVTLEGYGVRIIYDAVHNNAWVGRDGTATTMTPRQVAQEFKWRAKRAGRA